MAPCLAAASVFLTVAAVPVVLANPVPDYTHPACAAMSTFQADYVASRYDVDRHHGEYYELAFRDLYGPPPLCDCWKTIKAPGGSANTSATYHEDFTFRCAGVPFSSTINMVRTGTATYNQTIVQSKPKPPIPGINDVVFNTAVLAFKEGAGQQYEWVLEFTCGSSKNAVIDAMFPGGFVGLNLYSRTGPQNATNLAEMEAEVRALGLSWVMDKWGWGYHHVPARNCPSEPAALVPAAVLV